MKKILAQVTLLFLFACGVQQNLKKSHELNFGMTKTEVENIMGSPVKSDFRQSVEEWHYCRTGFSADEFIALFFFEGKLIEKINYTVTISDTGGAGGSCSKFIKMGNYKEPDKIIELRMR